MGVRSNEDEVYCDRCGLTFLHVRGGYTEKVCANDKLMANERVEINQVGVGNKAIGRNKTGI